MEATPIHLQVNHLTACIFSVFSLVVWLIPSLNGVSKIRLTLYIFLAVPVTFLCSSCQAFSCSFAQPHSHIKSGRESGDSHNELVLIDPGISGDKNWSEVGYCWSLALMTLPWLPWQARTCLHLLNYVLTPPQYAIVTRLSPTFHVRVWLHETNLAQCWQLKPYSS